MDSDLLIKEIAVTRLERHNPIALLPILNNS
jgi:hypothetical protein